MTPDAYESNMAKRGERVSGEKVTRLKALSTELWFIKCLLWDKDLEAKGDVRAP
jgi:hypothetical protein